MALDGYVNQIPDSDPGETTEWLDSLDGLVEAHGKRRARFIISKLLEHAAKLEVGASPEVSTPYVNTIPPEQEPWFPGDDHIERRIRAYIRWNAAVMVVKANQAADGIGGHLASYASSASLIEVGFNHFFRGKENGTPGDHVYFQGHAAPGIYARAFLEGRLTEAQLDRFRREVGGGGLSSYPHPRLMPDFWEYPTVSMGLGPLNSIYDARFLKYLHNRRLDDTTQSRVWAFLGDGETDEPESLGSISLAAREGLDNLTWVINCNLQRLDGPVWGNGKIIQELEQVFRGAGWNVIKVIWGRAWDALLAKDTTGALLAKMNSTIDGQFQRYAVEDGNYARDDFFGPDPQLRKMVEHLSDDDIRNLPRGGHDYSKLYAAYKAATEMDNGKPTVILAKTVKGWTLGPGVEGRNSTHQIKKMTTDQLRELRTRLHLEDEVPEASLDGNGPPPYITMAEGSPEAEYLRTRTRALDGSLPARGVPTRKTLTLPADKAFDELLGGSGGQAVSTTMGFTRLLRNLTRDKGFGERVVPIVPDEARTFGMDSLFREIKIYASRGQLYEPVDHDLLLSYSEGKDGQILEEGITEAGSMASFIAAGTAHANRGIPMVPFYIFYSMFGFQRIGDLAWLAADARARGFLLGATAGRTTLMGEGLQHQDGHSLVLASTIPTVEAYDPAFAFEVALLVKAGLERMYGPDTPDDERDVYYYLTLYNENFEMPAMPGRGSAEASGDSADAAETTPAADDDVAGGVVAGMYRWADAPEGPSLRATILFSGSAYGAALAARDELAERWDVGCDLWSVTSYKKLREDALAAERWNRLHPTEPARTPLVTRRLGEEGTAAPVVAVTDFIRAVPDQVSRWTGRQYTSLGTDGFGRSDTREALRSFFEVDAGHIVVAVLAELARAGVVDGAVVTEALGVHDIDTETAPPWVS